MPVKKVKKKPVVKKKAVVKKKGPGTPKKTAPKKKKISSKVDRFAAYRNIPGGTPVKFAANGGGVTMMTKNGRTFTVKRGRKPKKK